MVYCKKCGKSQEVGKSTFSFPMLDAPRLTLWEKYVSDGFVAKAGFRLCEDEFDTIDVKEILQSNGEKKKVLLPGAVPKGMLLFRPTAQDEVMLWLKLECDSKSINQQVKLLFQKLWIAQTELLNLKNALGKFANSDQVEYMMNSKRNNKQWKPETIAKAYQILAKVGTHGYNYLREEGWPLPSLRTLQEYTSQVPYLPGSQVDMIKIFGTKVHSQVDSHIGELVIMGFDEMAVRPRIEFDKSSKTLIGLISPDLPEKCTTDAQHAEQNFEPANHLQVSMIRGMAWHDKLIIDYNFTGSTVDPDKLKEYHFRQIRLVKEEANLFVTGLSCDYGPTNQRMLNSLNIKASNKHINCTVPHPADASKLLIITTDPPHGLKGIKKGILTYIIKLPERFVKLFNLPVAEFNAMDHLKKLIDLQTNSDLVLVPNLTKENLQPRSWESMRMSDALAVFNLKTVAALRTCVENGWLDESALSTAKFIEVVTKWYSIMSGRQVYEGLYRDKSKHQTESKLEFLEDVFIPLIQNLEFVNGISKWLHFQSSVLISTKAVLMFYDLYVVNGPLEYFLPCRMTTEGVENVFSLARVHSGDAHPTPLQAKTEVKRISLTKALDPPKGSSYAGTSDKHLVTILDFPLSRKKVSLPEATGEFFDSHNPEAPNAPSEKQMRQYALYHLAGWAMMKVFRLNEFKDCADCKSQLLINQGDIEELAGDLPYLFTLLLSYGGLKFVGGAVYHLARMAFDVYNRLEKSGRLIEYGKVSTKEYDVISRLSNECLAEEGGISLATKDLFPHCHAKSLKFRFLKYLFTSIHKRKMKLLNEEIERPICHAGKSALMRTNPMVENKGLSKRRPSNDAGNIRKKRRIMSNKLKSIPGMCSTEPNSRGLICLISALFSIEGIFLDVQKEHAFDYWRNSSKDSAAKVMFELLKLGQALFVTEFELEKIDNLKVAMREAAALNELHGAENITTYLRTLLATFQIEKKLTVFKDYFLTTMTLQTECTCCGKTVCPTRDSFYTTVDQDSSPALRMQELLNKFCATYASLDGACNFCHKEDSLRRRLHFTVPPKVLVVELKRPQAPNEWKPIKADGTLTLKLASNTNKRYVLVALVALHDNGFIAMCRRNNSWYKMTQDLVIKSSKLFIDKELPSKTTHFFYKEAS